MSILGFYETPLGDCPLRQNFFSRRALYNAMFLNQSCGLKVIPSSWLNGPWKKWKNPLGNLQIYHYYHLLIVKNAKKRPQIFTKRFTKPYRLNALTVKQLKKEDLTNCLNMQGIDTWITHYLPYYRCRVGSRSVILARWKRWLKL